MCVSVSEECDKYISAVMSRVLGRVQRHASCTWIHVFLLGSPVVLEAGRVVAVEDVPPTVDVYNTCGHCDEQHQCELDHVTDLNQHGGGH